MFLEHTVLRPRGVTVNRSKNIGTAVETAVVRHLQNDGWPHAERRQLRGREDAGDITGTPGIAWECKGGEAAKNASDGQVLVWLAETQTERIHARADIGVLVLARRGIGPQNAGRWWAVLQSRDVALLLLADTAIAERAPDRPVRMLLTDACAHLKWAGYGTTA